MPFIFPAITQPNGDVLVPAATAEHLATALERLQRVLEQEHGLRIADTGPTETSQETANRQDFVDQLSASVGVVASKVPDSRMPATNRTIDHAELIDLVRELSRLLPGRG